MTMHEEWTERLSDSLDLELSSEEREAVDAHLKGCAECTALLNDLKRVVATAQAIAPRPPEADLWAGIAERLDGRVAGIGVRVTPFAARQSRRIAFTFPQLAAAAALVATVSGGLVWQLRPALSGTLGDTARAVGGDAKAMPYGAVPDDRASVDTGASPADAGSPDVGRFRGVDSGGSNARIETVGLADAQYDAAVADLEKALKDGRGRLDASTISIVEHNLQIIDQAIEQARQALVTDPANSYLSSHLVETRRRKLDLLRRAAALTTEAD